MLGRGMFQAVGVKQVGVCRNGLTRPSHGYIGGWLVILSPLSLCRVPHPGAGSVQAAVW